MNDKTITLAAQDKIYLSDDLGQHYTIPLGGPVAAEPEAIVAALLTSLPELSDDRKDCLNLVRQMLWERGDNFIYPEGDEFGKRLPALELVRHETLRTWATKYAPSTIRAELRIEDA